ncbi:MAG: long-chain N-acyl amino acid synthase [Rubrivivax sp.]|nr:long-chain N-acyl amino acid synthase [Rubrivivax sp.]
MLALLSIDHGRDDSLQTFRIRAARAETHRQAARQLVRRMYSHRGYLTPDADEPVNRNTVTLVVAREDEPVGTLTVGFDSAAGLLCDELFGPEVDSMRRSGRKVCEFTKLALDIDGNSKQVLASLFHMAYLHAHRIRGCDDVIIEVNPRHVGYYERMLDFRVVGEEKLCPRVNAPAVLMALELAHTRRQIERYAGRFEMLATQRSLYPYAFVPEQEQELLRVLHGSAPSSLLV